MLTGFAGKFVALCQGGLNIYRLNSSFAKSKSCPLKKKHIPLLQHLRSGQFGCCVTLMPLSLSD
jgi:hypothetical protein